MKRVLVALLLPVLVGSACGSGHSDYRDGYNWAKFWDRPGWVDQIGYTLPRIDMREQANRVCMLNSCRQMTQADHQADWVLGCMSAINSLPNIAPH